ncbi:MAG: restriction endonuclease subunit S [Bacteroidales bacterium]|nr:restriction endonuclease subunit S [Candidatus Colimorpha pelethequi]
MKYRLGDICSITKGDTGIMKAIPGPYTMVTLGDTNKTHNEYQFDADAVIIPLVSSTGHGHASMRQVKYQEGKFALGNILCAVIPNDDNFVLAKYLQIYLHLYRNELLVSQMKGMANVSLPMNRIADVQVEIPDIEKQRKIVEIEKKVTQNSVKLHQLFFEQKGLTSKLKQTILQNALQGKLTAEWRKEHPAEEPASELLKRIKLEKQQMIASGKLKKEKPLEPIKPEEIPFEIPEKWTWGRWGELSESIQYGYNAPAQENGRILMIRISDIQNNTIIWDKVPYCQIPENEINNYLIKKNDILFARTGGTVGKSYLVTDEPRSAIYAGYLIRTRYSSSLEPKFLKSFMESELYWSQLTNGTRGAAQPNCNGQTLSKMILPIPPLSEQQEIVRRIDAIMNTVNSLENQISESERTSEELLKAIVGEVMG